MKILVLKKRDIIAKGIEKILTEHFMDVSIFISNDKEEIFRLSSEHQFDVILMDFTNLNILGRKLLKFLEKHQDNMNVIILLQSNFESQMLKHVPPGLSGFADMESSPDDLIRTIEMAAEGYICLSKQILNSNFKFKDVMTVFKSKTPLDKLSTRESEVLSLLLNGKSVNQISEQLSTHQSTVSTLKRRIFLKLGVDNLISLHDLAKQSGY
jgi:two-component system invasion response regulator UvrY